MLDGAAALQAEWDLQRTVNVDMFNWWWEEGGGAIGRIVLEEFEMHRHHQRGINGASNRGWLRCMFYSIGQQLMKQDPAYYMLYTALRPDKQWRLVTYLYYTKYVVKGDWTKFKHIDVNVPSLLKVGRGEFHIQGSLSIDNEHLEPGNKEPGLGISTKKSCRPE